jgi:hypothetical protein
VVTEAGVDVAINRYIYQRGHAAGATEGRSEGKRVREGSGIPLGEEMEDTIDLGGIADITHLHVKVDEPVQFVHFHRKSRSIREMVDQSVDFAQVNRIGKDFFHVRLVSKVRRKYVFLIAGLGRKKHKISITSNRILCS